MKRERVVGGMMAMALIFNLSSCGEKEEMEKEEEEARGYVLARPNALPPAGTKVAVSGIFDFSDVPLVLRKDGKSVVGTRWSATEKVLSYEVVSPTQVKILVVKDVDTQKIVVGGVPRSQPPKTSPITGQALTFVLGDGGWTGTLDGGGELSEEQMEEVSNLADKLKSSEPIGVYGTAPRKVGDKWEVDPNNVPGMEDSEVTGAFRLSFDRLEELDGHQCAVTIGTINISGSKRDKESKGFELQLTATVTTYRSIDYLEDLKRSITGHMTLSGMGDDGVQMTVRGPFSMEQEAKLLLP